MNSVYLYKYCNILLYKPDFVVKSCPKSLLSSHLL